MKYKNQSSDGVLTLGANDQYLETSGISMDLGRFFNQAEADGGRPVCVIGSEVADNLFPNETPLGKTIRIGTSTFRVIGVVEKQGSFLGIESLDNRIVIPIESFFRRFGANRGIQINVKAADINNLDDTKEELRGILRKARHVSPKAEDDFAINQQELFVQTFNAIGVVVAGIGLFITALSLFVGAIGIMNIMFVSVTERTKEIGIRKAIGARRGPDPSSVPHRIRSAFPYRGHHRHYYFVPLSLLINQILPTSMPISVVAVAILISIIVGVVSGFLPANRASKLDPVEALRYE